MDKRMAYLVCLVITFAVAVFEKNDFIRFLLGFEILLGLAARAELLLYHGKVKAVPELSHNVFYKGEAMCIQVRGSNEAIVPAAQIDVLLKIKDRWANRELFASGSMMLDRKESGSLHLSFDPKYCGAYEVEIRRVRVRDPLGIFRANIPQNEHTRTVYVLPETAKTNAMDILFGDEESDGDQAEFKKGRSAVDTADIRDYRPGDLMNHIHWKLSAKERKLLVRELGEPLEKMNRLYLNLQYNTDMLDRDTWENFLDKAAQLSMQMLNGQRPHYVCWIDTEVRKLVEYRVADAAGLQDMLCGLLFARPWRAGEMTEVLEDIRWDETMEENLEINLQGEISSSGA